MAFYIHDLPDWPRFSWDRERIARLLAEARYRQGRLMGRMERLGFPLKAEASFDSLTQEVLKSSEIEGERLAIDQVRSSLARKLGVDIGALAPVDRKVEGIVEVVLDATQKFDRPLTKERLFGWHASLFPTGFSGLTQIVVGAWRDDAAGPMQVVSGPIGRERVHFEAPPASRVDEDMRAFLDWLNADDAADLVLKSALAHLRFVTIHPFADGNGRIARAIADMLLAHSEGSGERFYSMSAQIRTEREAYYNVLERTQHGDLDITEWLDWYLECLMRALERSQTVVGRVLQKARFWEAHAGEAFNDRQRMVLARLMDGFDGKLTSSKWAKLAKCSQDTALRDIDDLVARGVLRKDAAGGRSTSYSLAADA